MNLKIRIAGEVSLLVKELINLIENSIDSYNGESGKIEIKAFKDRVGHGINPYITIAVKDYGCCISDNIKQNLFKKMVTTKGIKGTGIGLYISSILLKVSFNADISYESEERKETTLKISVPY